MFFNIFYLVLTSRDDYRDQSLISFHTNDPWFKYFTWDWDDFMERFLLVMPRTPDTHLTFCYSFVESSSFYKCMFLKCWYTRYIVVQLYRPRMSLMNSSMVFHWKLFSSTNNNMTIILHKLCNHLIQHTLENS